MGCVVVGAEKMQANKRIVKCVDEIWETASCTRNNSFFRNIWMLIPYLR